MADVVSKRKRSAIMSKVPQRDSKQELMVRRFLFSKGFRFRKNVKKLSGSPDVVLPKYKTVIFIHGCFWHGHENCKYSKLPTSNTEYWHEKIRQNLNRDNRNTSLLESEGWRVIIVWQCELKNNSSANVRLNKLIEEIQYKNL